MPGISKVIQNKIKRYQNFYQQKSRSPLVCFIPWMLEDRIDKKKYNIDTRPLDKWSFPEECTAYMENRYKITRALTDMTASINDDFIPTLIPQLGTGINSAYFSQSELTFSNITSWSECVIKEWSDLDSLKINHKSQWYQALLSMLHKAVSLCDEDICVQTFEHFGPMDMANALRGTALFTDIYDAPDKVRRLLDISAAAIIELEQTLFRQIPFYENGTVIWGSWTPGHNIFLSEDNSDLMSPAIYKEFTLPFTQKIAAAFDGCWIHHHAKGIKIHTEIAKVKKLKALQISLDPYDRRPIDQLEEIIAADPDTVHITRCEPKDVYKYIDTFKKGRLIIWISSDDITEAARAVDYIKNKTA
ncbi:MAG TPA: hypothetical protein VKS21_08105 [Spirochaetota bacterium]|nr:hypothetical protein [Spirochaetota bacterium]